MSVPRTITTSTRPVCNIEDPRRCRKTAVVSYDGVWICREHLEAPPKSIQMLVRIATPVRILWTARHNGL